MVHVAVLLAFARGTVWANVFPVADIRDFWPGIGWQMDRFPSSPARGYRSTEIGVY